MRKERETQVRNAMMLLAVVGFPIVCWAATPASMPSAEAAVQAEVRQAVTAWATGDFKVRESATRRLVEIGQTNPALLLALKEALANDDPEVADRARSVLKQLKYGLPASAAPKTKAAMQRFIDATTAQARSAAVAELIGTDADGCLAALTLARIEGNGEVQSALGRMIADRAGEFATMLLVRGETAGAEQVLCQPAVRHSPTQFHHYVAYQFHRGRADEAIRQEEAVPADQRDFRLLAALRLAKGELPAARAAAEKAAGEHQLLALIACLQFDWKAAADAFARQGGDTPGSDLLGAMALLYRRAGCTTQA